MPELPEVETIRRGLNDLATSKIVSGLRVLWPKSFSGSKADVEQYLKGAAVTEVGRRAKVLIVHLSSGYGLAVHLKMTGQLVLVGSDGGQRFGAGHPTASLVGSLPDKSTRIIIEFSDGAKLFFNDQRKFGWMKLMPLPEIAEIDFLKKVGPEPLAASFSSAGLAGRLAKRPGSSVKAALLDQSVIAGIGNIYADESLFLAGIHPAQKAGSLSQDEIKLLYRAIRLVLRRAIQQGGSTDKNYLNAEGQPGSYLKTALVFRRQGQPCRRCRQTICKIRLAGRGTHFCPNCQVAPANEQTGALYKVLKK